MKTICPETEIALFSGDGLHWFDADAPDSKRPIDWNANEQVTKIVIGTLESEDGKPKLISTLIPDDLANLYPNLSHLHLWQIESLTHLPPLPPKLECMDVRSCENINTQFDLPSTIEALVLDKCIQLPSPKRVHFDNLQELSIQNCKALDSSWINDVLGQNSSLRVVDASECPQLKRVSAWPQELVDARFNGCSGLLALPNWPSWLRRLELRGAERISKLNNFLSAMDYIDLGGMRALRQLPSERGKPRTLFLHGSGLLVPPASEHGKSATDNVAQSTAAYFADRELTGDGEVKRSKILVLGNGDAGKTCLSLALTGRDPALAQKLGSTHGIQFWDFEFKANLDGSMEDVQTHVWDFGGQEIYHSTHRLFMSKGAVFIVVWNPEQDGQTTIHTECGYEDELRPLRYWLEYIHMACPHKPRVAIVCARHSRSTPELESRWREQVPETLKDEVKCFYIDSLQKTGQLRGDESLEEWLQDEVGDVVVTQGTAVPSYWEIAQGMVEQWVKRLTTDAVFADSHNQLELERFHSSLSEAIERAIHSDGLKFIKLKEAVESGTFVLDDDRLRRTLNFLTNSGWIYWDKDLFEGRVIVGQKWALDGLYTILDRRRDSTTYRWLAKEDGRFTLEDLGNLAWNQLGFGSEEQKLLLSYMQQCGLCFQLRTAKESWREQDLFVSFEHLPTSKEIRLIREFDHRRRNFVPNELQLHFPKMHKQNWQNLLVHAGREFGKDATYAIDGIMTEFDNGTLVLIECDIDETGLSGTVTIHVSGHEPQKQLDSARALVKSFLGETNSSTSKEERSIQNALGKPLDHIEVFVSYAWNPPKHDGDSGIPVGYEEPVDEIERYLTSHSVTLEHGDKRKSVRLVRDKNVVNFGDSLRNFMKNGALHPHVIVVHSDKYWRSPDCIFELKCLFDELVGKEEKSFVSVVIPIEHIHSNIGDVVSRNAFLDFWQNYSGEVPSRCFSERDELKDFAKSLIRDFGKNVSDKLDFDIKWSRGAQSALKALAQRLNLPELGRADAKMPNPGEGQ
ncbi:MAG: hypothetical protein K9M08_07175 [Pirellula sp.]|nr:hypothetical protein [Pirellula sp.]